MNEMSKEPKMIKQDENNYSENITKGNQVSE